MHAANAILTQEILTKPWLLKKSGPEINQISHSRDVAYLLRSLTERIVWYAKVSLILILLKKTWCSEIPDKWSEFNHEENEEMQIARNVKNVVVERIDPLVVEVAAKLSYASCIRAEEAKYHKDCIQRFLSCVTVIPGPINYKHFISSKNDGFNNFFDWYESTSQDTTLSLTLL